MHAVIALTPLLCPASCVYCNATANGRRTAGLLTQAAQLHRGTGLLPLSTAGVGCQLYAWQESGPQRLEAWGGLLVVVGEREEGQKCFEWFPPLGHVSLCRTWFSRAGMRTRPCWQSSTLALLGSCPKHHRFWPRPATPFPMEPQKFWPMAKATRRPATFGA